MGLNEKYLYERVIYIDMKKTKYGTLNGILRSVLVSRMS
jgi:hypothetical protein